MLSLASLLSVVIGIPMTELLYHNACGLERGHERVLAGFGITSLRLNILVRLYPASC